VSDVVEGAVPPSAELLGEAARRVAEAYPGLYAHQRAGIAFLLSRRRAILADDMGLGKTRQAIIAVREAAPAGPFLVVCPAGVKLGWEREIQLVEGPEASVLIVDGQTPPASGVRWTVVNFDLLTRYECELASVEWAGVIVDEAHYIKNRSGRSAQVLRLVGAEGERDPQAVYLLTGTPMTNRPRDLFNLLRAVRHPLSRSFYSFARRYCAAEHNGYGLDTRGASNVEELARIMAGVMLRRAKNEALDLPPKTRAWLPVEVDAKLARKLEAQALAFYANNPDRSGSRWIEFLGRLNKARHVLAVAKVPLTIEAVRERVEAGEKVVVFSSYTAVLEKIAAVLGDQCVTITGSTNLQARRTAADRLQRDDTVRVLAGNLHAAGVGIALTAATHVVFNDLDWVPANHWQAEDRIYRIGQTRSAFVTYLCAERTLDDFVAALLEQKARTIGVLEEDAAHAATVVDAVVEAAVRGERPAVPALPREPGQGSVGLLGDVLDLFVQASRGLGELEPTTRVIEIPSKSEPDSVYRVTIDQGVPSCECKGFGYRGTCSHIRAAIDQLEHA
jgi:SWI/SNF-related matrix-associated actin-dependent regulator of chromatin subfamily A-like protein 1